MRGEIDYTCSKADPGVINVTDALAYVICPFGFEAPMLGFEEKGLSIEILKLHQLCVFILSCLVCFLLMRF